MKEFLTVKEFAEMTGLSIYTVYKMLKNNKIKSIRTSKRGKYLIIASQFKDKAKEE